MTDTHPASRTPDRPLGRAVDGRAARWERHRAERRVELVDATLRAIREHGAGVGMDEIAAFAGTSKTVFYRHFEDRAGLHHAVAGRVDAQIMGEVMTALGSVVPGKSTDAAATVRATIRSTIDTYLALVERDPDVYRFVVHPPLDALPDTSPVQGIADRVVEAVRTLLAAALGRPASGAEQGLGRAHTWAVALVGSVRAVSDDWLLSSRDRPRQDLVDELSALAWQGLAPVFEAR